MPLVRRIFVEKIKGFDIEAEGLLADLRENLGLSEVEGLRMLCRYDISGLDDESFEHAKSTIFSEPNVDYVYETVFPLGQDERAFAVEALPGQFDQRADSAAQCVQLLTGSERPLIACAKVYILRGNLSENHLNHVKKYIINSVESREASPEIPETLEQSYPVPEAVETVTGFTAWEDERVAEYHGGMGFAMTLGDLAFCRDYFRGTERRDPTVTELRVIDTYWSDHCRHTTFLTQLDDIAVSEEDIAVRAALEKYFAARAEVYGDGAGERPVTLMDMATIGAKLLKKRGLIPDLDQSDEINACSVEVPVTVDGVTEPWLIQFKNETHNHPTEIEPFGGAATCLGGAIRDPLSGRAYVYQAMRVTGAADPRVPIADTMPGKLPQRKITRGAAAGYSSYGNQIGLATGQVTEVYDPGYAAKRMEIGAVVGASPKSNVRRAQPQPSDIIILIGGRTGRDGCGGATGSSKAHTGASLETCGAEVQKGNPPTERKIQRLFRDPEVSRMIKRCNDFGAGGVCVAIGELADGLDINLDSVRKKYDGLDGTELAISESQERMAVVVDRNDAALFIEKAAGENLEAYEVAAVTGSPRLIMKWKGAAIVDISREFLNTNGVAQHAAAKVAATDKTEDYRKNIPDAYHEMPIREAFFDHLTKLNVCSQKGMAERFDASIGAASVIMPFGGANQLTPEEAMVARVPVSGVTDDATAMAFGFDPGHMKRSPFHGAAYAVVESLSKLAAVGADPLSARLTFQEYFERLGEQPERWGKPVAALLGALEAQLGLDVPSIGGKDSMSGSFNDLDVPPTLVSFAVAMTSAKRTVSAAFKRVGSRVVMIPVPENSGTKLPDWDKLKRAYTEIFALAGRGGILAASAVREGGAAAAVARMCFGGDIGCSFSDGIDKITLFAPQTGALILELSPEVDINLAEMIPIGETVSSHHISINGETMPLHELKEAWMSPLETIFPVDPKTRPGMMEIPLRRETFPKKLIFNINPAKPRVFIPVFPGTNCETDTERAFLAAGAEPELMIFRNLTPADVAASIEKMARDISRSQMIMLPGGFSAGDEPDGSGKFIATALRNPRISEAVTELLENRGGLILGICNGFQALIKTGLLPYGRIAPIKEDDPTLTFNSLGRHVSRMVYTRVASTRSPWLAGCQAGDVHCVPVSHGEGRFAANDDVLRRLIDNGQVATQYCTPAGEPSPDIAWNPNGSVCAIEGITSPDGRVFGKMAHSERAGQGLLKNVPGEWDQRIFESGVKYFK